MCLAVPPLHHSFISNHDSACQAFCERSSQSLPHVTQLIPGRKCVFRAGFRPDSNWEGLKIGPPAGRPCTGRRADDEAFLDAECGRSPARKPDPRPGALLHNIVLPEPCPNQIERIEDVAPCRGCTCSLWEVISNLLRSHLGGLPPPDPQPYLVSRSPDPSRWGAASPQTPRLILGPPPPRHPQKDPDDPEESFNFKDPKV